MHSTPNLQTPLLGFTIVGSLESVCVHANNIYCTYFLLLCDPEQSFLFCGFAVLFCVMRLCLCLVCPYPHPQTYKHILTGCGFNVVGLSDNTSNSNDSTPLFSGDEQRELLQRELQMCTTLLEQEPSSKCMHVWRYYYSHFALPNLLLS